MGAGIWSLTLSEVDDLLLISLEGMLSSTEQSRLIKITHPQRRRAFICGHALSYLAYRHCYPKEHQSVHIVDDTQGRPQIVGGRAFDFSLTHSGDICLCAFSICGRVGVDLERQRIGRNIHGIAEHYFHPKELQLLAAAQDYSTTFYTLWVLREALLKMHGIGLQVPLQKLRFFEKQGEWHYGGELKMGTPKFLVSEFSGYLLGLAVEGVSPLSFSLKRIEPGSLIVDEHR